MGVKEKYEENKKYFPTKFLESWFKEKEVKSYKYWINKAKGVQYYVKKKLECQEICRTNYADKENESYTWLSLIRGFKAISELKTRNYHNSELRI